MLSPRRFLAIITILALTLNTYSQTGCPRGYVLNCKGMCGLYKPNNKFGYCQYSALSDDIKKLIYGTKDTVVIKKDTIVKEQSKEEKNYKNQGFSENEGVIKEKKLPPCSNENETSQSDSNTKIISNNDTINIINETDEVPHNFNKPYDIISIFGLSLALYLFTYFLSKKKILKKYNHKKIWNIILLITFLVTGFLGLFMVIQLNFNFEISWFRSLLYWHVEFGVAMAAISIFHILWHIKYFVKIFKKEKYHHKKQKRK